MTKKLWFQSGVAILLALLIIKFFLEINYIFAPIGIIAKAIILPLVLGGVLYYMTEPIQRFLEKRKVPRWGSILIIFVILIGGVYAFYAVVGPPIANEVNKLIDNGPTITKELTHLKDVALEQKKDLPPQLEQSLNNAADKIQSYALKFGGWFVSFLQSFVQAIVLLVLVPFFFVFMLKDHEKLAPKIYKYFNGKRREWVKKTIHDIDHVLRSYIQGQFLISAILATIILIGYWIIGLQYALLIAIFTLFMNLIPFIGPWIAVMPAILIAFAQDPKLVIWVAVITLIANQVDSNFITPNVMGKSLDIHPLTVITLLLAAGNIAGFVGIIVAVPVYGVAKVIVTNIYAARKDIKKTATKTV
ncbi:AI-2E family transporter [Sporosarcina sp. BI001-red]|uniref:AI-2E family transporter n=1 Tax=Sporosarcina sp. BI001-red TaxID=2282866 RepID=UPI000E27DB90|nr:AI-2E family transporter [Sporosarcina sp. BI001-red]REB06064.1 AI-2E family transporter [Sporosarcina sp. BI001-red]